MEDYGDNDEAVNCVCQACGGCSFSENDGFYYCKECGSQAEGIVLTGVADEDFIDKTGAGGGGIYSARFNHRSSQPTTFSQATEADPSALSWYRFTQEEEEEQKQSKGASTPKKEPSYDSEGIGPTEPDDFGTAATLKLSYKDYCDEVRGRYVVGLQWMLQLQCEALVDNFGVSPLICGVASSVWMRFVAVSGVFKDDWADAAITESESLNQSGSGDHDSSKIRSKHSNEPHNIYGQRAVMVWFRSLKKVIPLDYTLAVCYLACHVAREAVLPTDIANLSLKGAIPYFAAHIDIEKQLGGPSLACPISSEVMFRPSQPIPFQKLEAAAATIAESVGLKLPPVNFYAVACCYLSQLRVPGGKILPHACRIYEWSMPPDLWLSTSELRFPAHVCVMSILVVAIRILYNLNGFGAWERSLSKVFPSSSGPAATGYTWDEMADSSANFTENACGLTSEFDSEELLHNLETGYSKIGEPFEFAKDLASYLRYCKDVVFAGSGSSSRQEDDELIEKLWDYYERAKYYEPVEEEEFGLEDPAPSLHRSKRDDSQNSSSSKSHQPESSQFSEMSPLILSQPRYSEKSESCQDGPKEEVASAIRKLKSDMEENMFCYIPPRVKVKRGDAYLQYTRKQHEGSLRYVAHADYYILLRSCARVAQVDIRTMHMGVLGLERRLAWLEKRIDHCLHDY